MVAEGSMTRNAGIRQLDERSFSIIIDNVNVTKYICIEKAIDTKRYNAAGCRGKAAISSASSHIKKE